MFERCKANYRLWTTKCSLGNFGFLLRCLTKAVQTSFVLLVFGCTTVPKKEIQTQNFTLQGFEGTALVTRNGKQHSVNLNIVTSAPDRIRVEITGFMGIRLGTFASGDGVFYWVSPREKIFRTGASSRERSQALLGLPLAPGELVTLLLQDILPRPWACLRQEKLICDGSGVHLEMNGKNPDKRELTIISPKLEKPLLLVLRPVEAKQQLDPAALFQVTKPDGYRNPEESQ